MTKAASAVSPISSGSLDALTIATMMVLCASWGVQHVAVKLALVEIPPLTQSASRCAIAAFLVTAWSLARGGVLSKNDGVLAPGLAAGFLFGAEFVLIYLGLQWTSASRAVLFVNTAPFFVAFGSIWLLPNERLDRLQWLGLACSFIGVALALGLPAQTDSPLAVLGDLMIVAAGALWAATTLLIKSTALRTVSPEKVLLYQLSVCAVMCCAGALILGERIGDVTPIGLGSLAYQSVWVAGATYLVWFQLVRRHEAGRLSAFTFVTPLCGVAAGYFILSEPLDAAFLLAAALVAFGLILVNRPRRSHP